MTAFSSVLVQIDNFNGPGGAALVAKLAAGERDAVIAADHPSSVRTLVDGREGAALESVHCPNGSIVFQFGYLNDVVQGILDMLVSKSPFAAKRSGAVPQTHYRQEHAIFIDGTEVSEPPTSLIGGSVVVLVNLQPYARKIEKGFSAQAPDGVYEVVARLAQSRWGSVAEIDFSYQMLPGVGPSQSASVRASRAKSHRDDSFPAITIKARS